jgi:glycosyltransferase involved in cell wall biosynthesis
MLSTNLGVGGGAEEQVMLLSSGLSCRGWDIKIVSLLPPSRLSAEFEKSNIPVTSLQMRRGVPDPRAILRLSRELRSFRPHVVHCHMPQANLLARVTRAFHPIPAVISTLHNTTMEKVNGGSGRFLEMAHGLTDRLSDLTTVICSPAVRGYVERGAVPSDKIQVYYNGVNTARYRPNPEVRRQMRDALNLDGLFVWLAVGRFTLAKAYPTMIRAFAKLIQKNLKPSVLLICGQGPLEHEVRALIQSCGVEEHVRLLGIRPDIPQIMNASDAFVLSSSLEGLPMVLLQAAASGLPIAATSVGGNVEAVIDGRTGFLVGPGNPEALAEAMEKIAGMPDEERDAIARAARDHAAGTFDLERILDRWEGLYASLIKEKCGENLPEIQAT